MRKLLAVMAATAALAFAGPAQALEWQGFYVGAQAGYGWGEADVDIPEYEQDTFTVDADGFTAGAFAGTRWEGDNGWSFGLEVEGNWTDTDGEDLSGGDGGELYVVEQNWSAAVRVLAAYEVMDNTRIYGAAGVAFTDIETSYDPDFYGSDSDTVTGWTAAIGVEHDYSDQVFSRFEVRYTDYEDAEFEHGGPSIVDLDGPAIMIGVGWRFGE